MPSMDIILDGDKAWPDLLEKMEQGKLLHYAGQSIGVAALPGGMQSGRTSVTLRFDLPDGTVLVAETSLRLFLSAARALRAKYGDEE